MLDQDRLDVDMLVCTRLLEETPFAKSFGKNEEPNTSTTSFFSVDHFRMQIYRYAVVRVQHI